MTSIVLLNASFAGIAAALLARLLSIGWHRDAETELTAPLDVHAPESPLRQAA
jgi:hypothetical protein